MWSSVIRVWIHRIIAHSLHFCMIYPLLSRYPSSSWPPLRMLSHCHLSDSSSLIHCLPAVLTPLTLHTFNSVGNRPIGSSRYFPVRGGMFSAFSCIRSIVSFPRWRKGLLLLSSGAFEPSLFPCFLNIPWIWRWARFSSHSNL